MLLGTQNDYFLKPTLYKAISSSNGDWICGYVVVGPDGAYISGFGRKQIIEYEAVIPDTICQLTPLRTINDDIIYEFDVILYDDNEYYVLCCNFPCWYYLHLIEVENEDRFEIDTDTTKHIVPNPHIKSKVKKIICNFKDLSYPFNKGFRDFDSNSNSNSYIN